MLTQKDKFFDRSQACQLVATMLAGTHLLNKNKQAWLSMYGFSSGFVGDEVGMIIELPPPCIQKPMALWSGKQIFSLILRPNREDHVTPFLLVGVGILFNLIIKAPSAP